MRPLPKKTVSASTKSKVVTTDRRNFLVPLWAGLLIVGSLAPPFAVAGEHGGSLSVHIDDGLITLTARNAALQDVLAEIAAQSNLRVVQHVPLDRIVSLAMEAQPLPEVLKHVLADDSYQLYQAQPGAAGDAGGGPETDVLWIFSEGSSMAPAATVFFEAVLFHGNVRERKEAIRGLRKLGTVDAVQALSLALGDEDPGVRDAAFEALAGIGSDEALAAIASASMDDDAWVRGEAASSLAASDSESAVQYLQLALEDPNPNVRMFVVEAFADIPGEQSMRAIKLALGDEHPAVRMQAVDALEQIGGDTALEALSGMRSDEDPEVREAVSDALLLLEDHR